jgi:hypothetical protein
VDSLRQPLLLQIQHRRLPSLCRRSRLVSAALRLHRLFGHSGEAASPLEIDLSYIDSPLPQPGEEIAITYHGHRPELDGEDLARYQAEANTTRSKAKKSSRCYCVYSSPLQRSPSSPRLLGSLGALVALKDQSLTRTNSSFRRPLSQVARICVGESCFATLRRSRRPSWRGRRPRRRRGSGRSRRKGRRRVAARLLVDNSCDRVLWNSNCLCSRSETRRRAAKRRSSS